MISKLVFCLLFAQFIICATGSQNTTDALKIIFANIIFRHGDRTIILPYPNDPYRNESLWPVPFGQLTNLGKHQHYQLGQWFRKRYDHLIPKTYSLYDIYIRSTDVDRTLMSAEANLAGLYPPFGDQQWDIKNWMPIPIHTVPQEEDVLGGKKYCERYNYELEKVLNSLEIVNLNKKNQELYDYLNKMTGCNISSLQSIEYLYNILYIEELYNKTLPEWTHAVYPHKMKPLADKSFAIETYNQILKRFKSGPLLKKMIENMVLKSKNTLTPNRKLWMFSGHDETIANMLNTLGLFELHCPPYTASLLIELRVNVQNNHFVTISYKNSTDEPVVLTLPGCTIACPLDQFIALTKDVIPENWERECLMGFKQYQLIIGPTALIVLAMLTISLIMLIILLAIAFYFYFWFKRRENRYYYHLVVNE